MRINSNAKQPQHVDDSYDAFGNAMKEEALKVIITNNSGQRQLRAKPTQRTNCSVIDHQMRRYSDPNKHSYEEKTMSAKIHFTAEQAREIGDKLGIDWSRFDVEQFRMGLDVELEHGLHDPSTDVTGNDPILTGKIALAHLKEFADYYTRLEKMERDAEEELGQN